MNKIAIIADIHLPFQNDFNLNRALDEIKEFKPDCIVIDGDLIDSPHLGRYVMHPKLREQITDEIALAHSVLADLRKEHPKVRIIYVEGNHDWRVKGYLIKNAPELYDESWLPEKLQLSKLRIEWMPTKATVSKWTDTFVKIDDVYIGHFDFATAGAGNTVRRIKARRGNFNIVQAHIHRGAIQYQTDMERKTTWGMEVPALCKPPHYGSTCDEQNGWAYLIKEHGKWNPYLRVF